MKYHPRAKWPPCMPGSMDKSSKPSHFPYIPTLLKYLLLAILTLDNASKGNF